MRRIAAALVLGFALLTVGLPVAGVAFRTVWPGETSVHAPTGAAAPGGAPASTGWVIASTLFVPALIAVGAVAIAWPTCWALRGAGRHSRAALALLVVPMLMPSYLAYAGFGLARAPGTWLGEVVNRWPPTANVLFGQGLAVLGLILWCWPLATVAMLGAVRRIGQEHLDQLALSGAGGWAALRQRAAMVRGALLSTLALVTLLMLGSAVPLHLAQVPTLAIDLWAQLALAPASTGVWLKCWPLLIVAGAGSVWIAGWVGADEPHDARTADAPRRPRAWLAPVVAWAMGVVFPLAAMAGSIKHTRLLADFWRGNGESAVDSLAIAAVVGCLVALLALAAWYAVERPAMRRVVRWAFCLQLIGLLLPGVLMGSAIVGLLNHPILGGFGRFIADTTGAVVLGHIARFGALGTAAGLWLARLEAPSLRDARRLSGGDGVRVWLLLAVRPQIASLIGVGVAGACLSLHEIEATVQLQPPGYRSLAQVMLDHLHMNSVHELAAAGVSVLGAGLALAVIGAFLVGRASSVPRPANEPDATGSVSNR